jgi:hypothetical protein
MGGSPDCNRDYSISILEECIFHTFAIFATLAARGALAISDFQPGRQYTFAGKAPAPSVCDDLTEGCE